MWIYRHVLGLYDKFSPLGDLFLQYHRNLGSMYKKGAFSLAFYDLVNTQSLAPEQGSYWTQKVTSKAEEGFKVAPLLGPRQAGNLTT